MAQKNELQVAENTLLTLREDEVAYWNAQGKSNPEIALILNISPETVKVHLKHICDKFHVYNRTAMVTEAFRHGILKFTCVIFALFVQMYIDTAGIDTLRPRPGGRIRITKIVKKTKEGQESSDFGFTPGALA